MGPMSLDVYFGSERALIISVFRNDAHTGNSHGDLVRTPLTGNPLNNHTSFRGLSAKHMSKAGGNSAMVRMARRPVQDMSRIRMALSKSTSKSRFDECL